MLITIDPKLDQLPTEKLRITAISYAITAADRKKTEISFRLESFTDWVYPV